MSTSSCKKAVRITRKDWEQSLGLVDYSIATLLMAAIRKQPKLRPVFPRLASHLDRLEKEPIGLGSVFGPIRPRSGRLFRS
jgi:hypothetical protein